jgi:hypothetical protein
MVDSGRYEWRMLLPTLRRQAVVSPIIRQARSAQGDQGIVVTTIGSSASTSLDAVSATIKPMPVVFLRPGIRVMHTRGGNFWSVALFGLRPVDTVWWVLPSWVEYR